MCIGIGLNYQIETSVVSDESSNFDTGQWASLQPRRAPSRGSIARVHADDRLRGTQGASRPPAAASTAAGSGSIDHLNLLSPLPALRCLIVDWLRRAVCDGTTVGALGARHEHL